MVDTNVQIVPVAPQEIHIGREDVVQTAHNMYPSDTQEQYVHRRVTVLKCMMQATSHAPVVQLAKHLMLTLHDVKSALVIHMQPAFVRPSAVASA